MAGRKNKYETNLKPNMDQIVGYLNGGYTEASVAKRFGVGVSTWERYKVACKEFKEAIKKSGMNATALVVNALHKRATGYEYEETHVIFKPPKVGKDGKPKNQIKEIRKVTKHVSPDTAACIFWTTNRDPKHWQNTQSIKHSGEIKNTGVLVVMELPKSTEEWSKQNEKPKSDEPDRSEKKKK